MKVLSTALRTGSPEGKSKVHKMFLDSNLIDRVDFIAENYKNLVLLELSNLSSTQVTIPSSLWMA